MTRRHLAWLCLLAVTATALGLAGRGVLGAPPLEPAGFEWWVARVGPSAAAMALLRLVTLGVVTWLAAAVLLDGLASHQRRSAVLALPRWLHVNLRRAAGVSLAVPLMLPATHSTLGAGVEQSDPAPDDDADRSDAPAGDGGGVAILRPLPATAPTTVSTTTTTQPGPATSAPAPSPTTSDAAPLPTAEATAPTDTTAPPTTAAQPAAVPVRPSPQPGRAAATETVISPGDSLWRLAEERMAESLGRAPTDAEVAPYWASVVDANRDRLRSGDPDVIYPGERIALPRP